MKYACNFDKVATYKNMTCTFCNKKKTLLIMVIYFFLNNILNKNTISFIFIVNCFILIYNIFSMQVEKSSLLLQIFFFVLNVMFFMVIRINNVYE